WQPLYRLPPGQDWRSTVAALLALDSRWLALHQRRGPTGAAMPDPADIRLTRMIRHRLRPLAIQLTDHVIDRGQSRFSFRAAGLL
ncbi:MAG: JAB domain-containing protein, partial [bacterium]|nr:JAB domain-containing protein [bacterium]